MAFLAMPMNDEQKFFENFLTFEKQNQLDQMQLKGVYFWELIRFDLYYHLVNLHFGTHATAFDTTSALAKLRRMVSLIPVSLGNILLRRAEPAATMVLPHNRKEKIDGIYTDIYSNFYFANSDDVLFIERTNQQRLLHPLASESVYHLAIEDWFMLVANLRRKLNYFSKDNKRQIRELQESLAQAMDVEVTFAFLSTIIGKKISNYKMLRRHLAKLLNRVQPKRFFQVVHYALPNQVLNQLCREKNIPTIEFQHGTMGSYHLAYNYDEGFQTRYTPGNLLMFGRYWINHTRFWAPSPKTKPIGFHWLESQKKTPAVSIKTQQKTIVFISQARIGEALSKLATNLHQQIDASKYKLVFKLHPSEYPVWRQQYPWLQESAIQVVDDASVSLYELFRSAHIQVGVSSTALYEGLSFNLDTFIYKQFSYSYMLPLIRNGHAILFAEADELVTYLNNGFDRIAKQNNDIWTKNALANFNQFADAGYTF
jgi:hypothetical protein